MIFWIRDFEPGDKATVSEVAVAAFEEFQEEYSDWPTIARNVADAASLAEAGELIVAISEERVVGAVTYVGPGRPKKEFFPVEWPIVRMLVVAPPYRGRGIGRALAQECIRRAERDGAPLIALHTSSIMRVALPMYERMGFEYLRDAPTLFGVPYGVYVKPLSSGA